MLEVCRTAVFNYSASGNLHWLLYSLSIYINVINANHVFFSNVDIPDYRSCSVLVQLASWKWKLLAIKFLLSGSHYRLSRAWLKGTSAMQSGTFNVVCETGLCWALHATTDEAAAIMEMLSAIIANAQDLAFVSALWLQLICQMIFYGSCWWTVKVLS